MKRGLFFGSFDPFHIGHLQIVVNALNSKLVDCVEIIPAYGNPWKTNQTPYNDRYWITKMSISEKYPINVNDVELKMHEERSNDEVIYTYEVIRRLKEIYKEDELIIITSIETFNEIRNWKNGEEVFNENAFIILNDERFKLTVSPKHCDRIYDIKPIDICSTKIRQMASEGKILVPYVLPNVEKIIRHNKLYQ